jgi:hypothetical protein
MSDNNQTKPQLLGEYVQMQHQTTIHEPLLKSGSAGSGASSTVLRSPLKHDAQTSARKPA